MRERERERGGRGDVKCRWTDKTVKQTDRWRDIQADRQTGRQTDRQAGRETDRQTGRETDRQRGRQTDRLTDMDGELGNIKAASH